MTIWYTLFTMERVTQLDCKQLDCKYWWLSVGLTYKSVSVNSSIRDTVTSKKLIEVCDHLAVNFMEGCTLLILSIKNFNLFSYEKIMSSLYLHQKHGLYSDSSIISSSSSAINKMLYRGANLVPIAVPRFCLSIFFSNVNMLIFNTTSAKSIMVSVETYFLFSFLVVFLMQPDPPHSVCLYIILQHP